ncbi:phage tail protein [Avibacterium paragallinarum]|uniref:Oxidoreductase n=1 Tax=Avibacterium paragallinarum TaxID=728 RepID=A0AAE5TJF3_AVIPA|nr:phage tail protein [Avibacterium paragallinarum]MEE3608168.1 phage tail protein [Avibacterium paragallinarum]MEE3621268.1 phage tail protein [Avibacterium paragallinarum]MEE3669297.1 phage tail protein [Avibacterium paragallinarum]MEE3681423.1 phage tail protein [Avibacterium paragallinarum]MEE4386733.1 phage tail protein [Avibacterium paragallinarum]
MLQNFAMMAYGFFVFMRATVPFQEMQRTAQWRHPTNSVIGRMPKAQFVGKESESITIQGVLMPSITGGEMSIATLQALAEQGEPYPLIDGSNFRVWGWYVIEEISETQSVFFADGKARRIDFSMKLKRTDDSLLADIGDAVKGLIS